MSTVMLNLFQHPSHRRAHRIRRRDGSWNKFRMTAKPNVVAALIKRPRGPQKAPTKTLISLRLDPDLIDHFRATGAGWQKRINDTLRKAAGIQRNS